MDILSQALPKIIGKDSKQRVGKGNRCEKHGFDFEELRYDYFCCPRCEEEKRKKKFEDKQLEAKIKRAEESLILPARLKLQTFDTYIAKTKDQKVNKSMCLDFVKSWKGSGGIMMVGNIGTGKTHLAVAICQKLRDEAVVCHISSVNKIVRKIRYSWNNKATDDHGNNLTEEQIIERYIKYDLLVIDEIGSQYGAASERVIINEIINDRYEEMLPTIIIGNVSIEEAKEILGERVVDRIKSDGYVMFFEWESGRKLRNLDVSVKNVG